MRLWLVLLLIALSPAAWAAAPFDPFGAARIDERPGAQVPLDARLVDARGRPTSLRAIGQGKPIVLTPVLHECPNICGVTLSGVADALAAQDDLRAGRDFAVVAFGIDPEERPADARADIGRLAKQRSDGLPASLVATVGDADQLHAVTDALGYHYAFDPRIGQYAHAAATAVLTPDGRLVRWLYGLSPDPAQMREALADAEAGRTGGFLKQLILLCYHYDPETGTYSLLIDRVVRYAGIATVVLIAALILFLRRRSA
ncbi:hypothetical protein B2G71_04795 [Novosphingobium sp. PC22D]|uniref:SCO family protein n=1 Tax=Novosphingobium sp. PC22D TaxID=1962403 RepID=UPI000BF073ED|nr:SCO family protein [Novosphingobium sp. PC22D]PEQ13648.1 hypothetical protein B2G71_04795 [Novosphingobium sp. PC22D]